MSKLQFRRFSSIRIGVFTELFNSRFIRYFLSFSASVAIILGLISPAGLAQPTSNNKLSAPIRPATAAARRMIQSHMDNLAIPGMQLAVFSKGKLICSESFGFADLEKKTPVTRDTAFRIGSISKSLAAAALALLVQRRLIDLDAPVSKYVQSFPQKQWPITIRQLAAHTSGIRHYRSNEEANGTKQYASVTESLDIFKNDPLLFEPGTAFEYSSYGYVLLSAVIEAASKQPFTDLMSKEVFAPLAMDHTTMDFPDKEIPFRSKAYVLDENDRRIVAPFVDNSSKWASGGMISSAEDLVRFGDALLGSSFLRPETANILFAPVKTRDGKETGYGLGWEVRRDANGRKVIVNDGSLPSARAVLALYPEEQLVIAVIANTGKGIFFNREEALMLADIFLDPQGLDPTDQEKKLAIGEYTYSTVFENEPVTGTINIFEDKGGLRGTMTIPNAFFKQRSIPVPVVSVSDSRLRLFGTPGNWISMDIEIKGEGIAGKWRFGPIKGDLKGGRKK